MVCASPSPCPTPCHFIRSRDIPYIPSGADVIKSIQSSPWRPDSTRQRLDAVHNLTPDIVRPGQFQNPDHDDLPRSSREHLSATNPRVELTMRPELQFPVEILDEVFSYAAIPTLARLSLVCRTFQGIATRLLYRHIPSLSLSRTTRLLQTLNSNPHLAVHVRSCEVGDASFSEVGRDQLLPSFYELLQHALRNMHRLTDLTFMLNGASSHVLLGAPFRLTKLTTSCDFDETFASWLSEQSSLRAAIFCGNFISGTALSADALPSLRRVSAAPLTLACVVPTRAVREVELCLVHPWSLNREVLQTTIRIISFSKGPLDSLKIISHLSESPETVLSALEAIPSGLGSITRLALHAVSGSITDDLLAGLPPILSQFPALKSLMLFSKNRQDALHTAASPHALAASCTSLERVVLPGATYVHNRRHGWVTLRDLAELLAKREHALAGRGAELHKREPTLGEGQWVLQGRERRLDEEMKGLQVELGGPSVVAVGA
ncbi:hypothetical protein BC834DRAFT_932741 [Gloeopeniophorella convolvens]|nr:hypothetical protein BC834DRAFT_932741 [Gloeopeniophorella convolvens]